MNSSTSLYLLLLLLVVSTAKVGAQDFPEWGKITAEEQAMTQYEQDTAAKAVVLLDYGKIDLEEKSGNITLTYNNYNRIKILKKAGFEVVDISIPYMPKDDFEQLVICKAQTIEHRNKKKTNRHSLPHRDIDFSHRKHSPETL